MFKKLKDKIAEEVKSSPQRIQQLTQSVTERLQNATNEDNFFTLADDDAEGFTDVSLRTARRPSNSSMASDVSFLPQYESPGNLYHMQSDLDVSASEIEDNASMSSQSQLGHVTKEQVYSAYQKAQLRYHKYRGRYSDIINHYKILEKENAKIKAVLVETQDKAIRRVSELREQCQLEQKAKAHLENALRVELDERQIKIDTLHTKIKLLKESGESVEENSEVEKLNAKLQEYKANAIVFNTKENDYKSKIKELSTENKENGLKLAQIKKDLHLELHDRDSEISKLRQEIDALKSTNLQSQNAKLIDKVEALNAKCQRYESDLVKLEQYKIENCNLNEIIGNLKKMNEEILSKKQQVDADYDLKTSELHEQLSGYESVCAENERLRSELDSLKLEEKRALSFEEKYEKQRLEYEADVSKMRDEARTSLLLLETKVKDKVIGEYEEKEAKIKEEFQRKLDYLSANENDAKLTQIRLMESEEKIASLQKLVDDLRGELQTQKTKYTELENDHLDLINESAETRKELAASETEVEDKNDEIDSVRNEVTLLRQEVLKQQHDFVRLRDEKDEEIARLRNDEKQCSVLQNEIALLQDVSSQQQNENCKLQETVRAMRHESDELANLAQAKQEAEDTLNETTSENDGLKRELRNLLDENRRIPELVEEITSLRSQITVTLRDSGRLEENLSKLQRVRVEYDESIIENESIKTKLSQVSDEVSELRRRNQQLSSDYKQIVDENEKNTSDFEHLKIQLENARVEATEFDRAKTENLSLTVKLRQVETELGETRGKLERLQNSTKNHEASLNDRIAELERIKSLYDALHDENKNIKSERSRLAQSYDDISNDKKLLQSQLEDLERHYNEIIHERQLLNDEIQEMKISPLDCKEIENLRDKLEQYKAVDEANRTAIEFYENELQKCKIKNEKLDRKLDETLVTLPALRHDGDSAAVLEYLRNVLFNYMTGKESLVLAKVIAAVCKFDTQQTELIIQREQQKQTLIGHIFGS